MGASDRLVIRDLTKRYDATPILNGVSLTARPGETIAIVGPSGSGKSTLLNIVGSLDRPTTGTVRLGDVEVTALEGKALAAYRAERVGFVFQEHHLLPQLTALENALLPTLALRRIDSQRSKPRAPRRVDRRDDLALGHTDSQRSKSLDASAAEDRARGLLDRMGVLHRAGAFPSRLSGGERQRVAVARALVNEPDLLLCDEPTGNLDRETGAGVVSLLLELARERGIIALMVTHNAEHAARFSRCLAMSGGILTPLDAVIPPVGAGVPPPDVAVSATDTDVPTVDTAIPTVGADVPTVDTAIPTVGTDVPTVDTALPTVGTDVPTVDAAVATVDIAISPVDAGDSPVNTK